MSLSTLGRPSSTLNTIQGQIYGVRDQEYIAVVEQIS